MTNKDREYAALRGEMMNLFSRILVVLVAMFTAYASLIIRSVEASSANQTVFFLLLLSILLSVGNLLVIAFYSNVYSIGSYISLYIEDSDPGWHLRSRYMRIKLANTGLDAPTSAIERINEPKTVSYAFLLMFLSLPIVFLWKYEVSNHQCAFYLLMMAFLIGCCLTWSLSRAFTVGSPNWTKRWMAYKAMIEEEGEPTVKSIVK